VALLGARRISEGDRSRRDLTVHQRDGLDDQNQPAHPSPAYDSQATLLLIAEQSIVWLVHRALLKRLPHTRHAIIENRKKCLLPLLISAVLIIIGYEML
jgi:hypothetical protein